MGVGYSDRRRDGNGLPSSSSLMLLVVVVVIIALKGGNRNKHLCLSPTFVVFARWSLLVSKSLRQQVVREEGRGDNNLGGGVGVDSEILYKKAHM